MSAIVPGGRGEREQDFRLLIGTEPFDPREVAPRPSTATAAATGQAARQATLVQFSAALTTPDADRLRAAYGLVLDRYIPNLAYLERLPAETVDRLRTDFLVRACLPLDPALKLAPWIGEASGGASSGTPLELFVTLFDDADVAAAQSAVGGIGAREINLIDERAVGGRQHLRLTLDDPARVAQIADIADVVWVEPVPVMVNANVEASQVIQSGRTGTNAGTIWDHGLHGEGQIISVTDDQTLDIAHCFFADGGSNKPGKDHRKVRAVLNAPGHGPSGHHTFVAGIAAGDDRGHPGAHAHRGGAWAARLVSINRDMMNHPGFLWTLRQVLDAADDNDATIHNASWGLTSSVYTKVARDADSFTWDHEDHIVIAAGENSSGPGSGVNSPPGTAKNTVCVAAAKAFPDHMFIGSGRPGPTLAGNRRKPDLMAVGCGIQSAKLGTACDTDLYEKFVPSALPCATSWATPQVAAAAALVRQYFVDGFYPTGKKDSSNAYTPTGALIKAVLLNSTVDMTGEPGYPSDAEGWGLIRLDRTLYFDGGPRRLIVRDVRRQDGLAQGRRALYWLRVKSRTEQLKLTLVWTDPPPSEPVSRDPAMNVLKLTVQDPAGVKYLGNDIDPKTGLSRPNGSGPQDVANNVQMVIVNNPPVDLWLVTIGADKVTGSDQGFALVASGGLDLFLLHP
jgi:subtilase family protein